MNERQTNALVWPKVKGVILLSENRKNYAIIGWLVCGLGALFYAYEYLLRIAPSAMETALREHFYLSATLGVPITRDFFVPSVLHPTMKLTIYVMVGAVLLITQS